MKELIHRWAQHTRSRLKAANEGELLPLIKRLVISRYALLRTIWVYRRFLSIMSLPTHERRDALAGELAWFLRPRLTDYITLGLTIPHNERLWQPPQHIGYRVGRRVIVFHHAAKAGTHLEMYLQSPDGTCYGYIISSEKIQYKTSGGSLTQTSTNQLVKTVRDKLTAKNGTWGAATTPHTLEEARQGWKLNHGPTGYGSGPIREVIADDEVEYLKSGEHWTWIDPMARHGVMKLAHIFNDGKTVTIRNVIKDGPDYEKLHLKKVEDFDKFMSKSETITEKYDGASTYFRIKGDQVEFWSPRISVVTGKRISYSEKLAPFIQDVGGQDVTGMGELMLRDGRGYLSAAQIAGVLNSVGPIPKEITPEVRVYWTKGEDQVTLPRGRIFKPVEIVSNPSKSPKGEGYVGIPLNGNVEEGYKYKPRDESDWELISVDLMDGPNGGIGGVTHWQAEEDGKLFKLGPSAGFSRDEITEIMAHPELYIGRVAKIGSFRGHEGRAGRFLHWHSDKGKG